MKKHFLLFLVLMLVLSTAVIAQAADNELNLLNVGHLFKWSYNSQDVFDILETYADLNVQSEEDDYSKFIAAEGNNEEKAYFYYFYFDSETDQLKEVEFLDIYFDDNAAMAAAAEVINAYDLDSVPAYEDDFTIDYITGFDGSMTVAGDKTICILAGTDPTEESYGYLSLVFLNKEF